MALYHMNCLLCKPGTEWNPPYPNFRSTDLVEMQEHLMEEHGYTQEDLRDQGSTTLSPGNYEYSLIDRHGDKIPWLSARVVRKGIEALTIPCCARRDPPIWERATWAHVLVKLKGVSVDEAARGIGYSPRTVRILTKLYEAPKNIIDRCMAERCDMESALYLCATFVLLCKKPALRGQKTVLKWAIIIEFMHAIAGKYGKLNGKMLLAILTLITKNGDKITYGHFKRLLDEWVDTGNKELV